MSNDDARRRAKIILTADMAPLGCTPTTFEVMAQELAHHLRAPSSQTTPQLRMQAMKCVIASKRIAGIDARAQFDDDPDLREHAHTYGARLDELERAENQMPVPTPFSAGRYQTDSQLDFAFRQQNDGGCSVCPICGHKPEPIVVFVHVVYDHAQQRARFARCDEPTTWDDGEPRDGGWWPVDGDCAPLLPKSYVEWTLPALARGPIGPLYVPRAFDRSE